MFKRRDWTFVNQRDGKDVDSDSDTESEEVEKKEEIASEESEEESSSASEEQENQDQSDGDVDSPSRDRGFARSFDDMSDPDDDDEATAQEVMKAWESNDSLASNFKAIPLRCVACDSLLLNSTTYKQHVISKRHLGKLSKWRKTQPPGRRSAGAASGICVAAACEPKGEEAETHEDRMRRIKQQVDEAERRKAVEEKKLGKLKEADRKVAVPAAAPGQKRVRPKKDGEAGKDKQGRPADALKRKRPAGSGEGGKAQEGQTKKRKRQGKRQGKNQRTARREKAAAAAAVA